MLSKSYVLPCSKSFLTTLTLNLQLYIVATITSSSPPSHLHHHLHIFITTFTSSSPPSHLHHHLHIFITTFTSLSSLSNPHHRWTPGKRKKGRATVQLYEKGTGQVTVNEKLLIEHFPKLTDRCSCGDSVYSWQLHCIALITQFSKVLHYELFKQ